jgi:alcohol dehydrogenase
MRALRFDGRSVVLDKSAPEPTPGPGEALVAPILMAASGADWPTTHPTDPAGPPESWRVLGHEFVGLVEHVHQPDAQPGFRHALVGQRVVASVSVSCATCDLCKKGLGAHCRQRRTLGQPGPAGLDGCFADRLVLPLRNLHPVPPGLRDELAVFAEPVASALHAKACFRPEGRPYITVLGDTAIGLLVAQVMAKLNASVRLVGTDPARLALCDRWGVRQRPLADVGRRADQDVVIECSGTNHGLQTALEMVRPRGRVILKQPTLQPMASAAAQPIDLTPAINAEVEIIGSRCGSISQALAALATGEVDVSPLILRRARLVDGPAVLQSLRTTDHSAILAA